MHSNQLTHEIGDKELIESLIKKYERSPPQDCVMCGTKLAIQQNGGGLPVSWGCPSAIENIRALFDMGIQRGEMFHNEMQHLRSSQWLDYRVVGDGRVLELVRRYMALKNEGGHHEQQHKEV